jgi:hypothetical protein
VRVRGGGLNQIEAPTLAVEQEARPQALSLIVEVKSQAPSPHTKARSRAPSLAAEAKAAALEDVNLYPSEAQWHGLDSGQATL